MEMYLICLLYTSYPSDFAATHHMGARVDPEQSRLDFALDLGSNHETPYGKTAITMTGMMNCYKFEEMVYCLSSDASYQVSLEPVSYTHLSTGVITFRKILLSVMNRLSAGRFTPSSKVLVQNIVVILPRRNMSSIRILMAAGRYPM